MPKVEPTNWERFNAQRDERATQATPSFIARTNERIKRGREKCAKPGKFGFRK